MTHPLHPTHTGKDVCDAVAMDTCSKITCHACAETITAHKPAYECLPCDFKLCRKCYEGSQHPVHVQHRLFLVNHLFGKKLKCEICHNMVGSNYYHCEVCNFNLCKRCFLPADTLLHEHRLNHTDVRYTYDCTKGEWCCDCCGGNDGSGNYFPRHCKLCQFDVCEKCSRPWTTPLHEHELFKADSLLVYKQYSGGWACDNCKEHFSPRYNKYPYHCSSCQYDLCERCLRSETNRGNEFPRSSGTRGTSGNDFLRPSGTRETSASRSLANGRSITRTAAGNPVTSPEDDVEDVAAPFPFSQPAPCVVCLSNPKNSTLVHGTTGHVCCCIGCAHELQRRKAPCPICRAPIDLVIQQFVS